MTEVKSIRQQLQTMPTQDMRDENYRRLWYIRYADDFLLGVIGPKNDAIEIKEELSRYLREKLKLDLNVKKTLITHARNEKAKFLGYEVHTLQCDTKRNTRGRSINGRIGLRVPRHVIKEGSQKYMCKGKPIHLMQRTNDNCYNIIAQYQTEYAGIAQYYRLAYNRYSLNQLKWVMQQSLVKTLACKYRTSCAKIYQRFGTVIATPQGTYKVLQAVIDRGPRKKPMEAHFGGISLRWNTQAPIKEKKRYFWDGRSELVDRLLARTCELCGSRRDIEVHHIRKLSDLNRNGRDIHVRWAAIMNARKRKTLIVCESCHNYIHGDKSVACNTLSTIGEPCDKETVMHGSEGSH